MSVVRSQAGGFRVAALLATAAALTGTGAAHAQDARPPQVVHREDALPPPEASSLATAVEVVLSVLVNADGEVEAANVTTSGGQPFDDAALAAVKRWQFRAAEQAGRPVRSRIRVSFPFAPPAPLSPEPMPAPAPPPSAPAVPAATVPGAAAPLPAEGPAPTEITVHGAATPPIHGASDFQIRVGELRAVPRANASEFLKLAPGILLSNDGGEGHAEQVFLRGFDAREGQDIEFSVDGVPINDVGNIHGNGYADTHFILPELVLGLRVTEGPFLPEQGNFAVAGSADYHLGLDQRGVTVKGTYGSWNTERLVLLWGPAGESPHTFGGAEVYRTDGYGQNRAATRASAMGQYEVHLASGATLRLGSQAYATHFQTAGVLRQDDVQAGKVAFYGTEDPLQGGDASRFSLYADYNKQSEGSAFDQTLFLLRRDMRLREDFTGFLLDTQNALDTLHGQRGDLIDMNYGSWTLGGKGLGRFTGEVFGLKQTLDLGYLARVDVTDGTQYRDTVPGNIPYKLETDLHSTVADIGLFADASLRPARILTLRGGLRVDAFSYDVLNACAAQGDFDNPSRSQPPTNQSCHDQLPYGAHREPVQRSSTAAVKVMPRATATVGPLEHLNFSVSYGEGVRSIDPAYISQDLDTPFASVRAYEGGVTYASDVAGLDVSARSIFFETKVDRDLVFNQTAGRNVLANGTTRAGWVGAARVTGSFFDESANLTLVRPTFDDTGLQIPYVPTVVFRDDAAFFHALPWLVSSRQVRASLGVGWTFVGRRALPYNQASDLLSVVDGNASLGWNGWDLSLAVTNLFNLQYRLGEYNYASDFHSEPASTLVPARHFTAGAPRGVFLSLSANFGGGA